LKQSSTQSLRTGPQHVPATSFEPGGHEFILDVIGFLHVKPSSTYPSGHFFLHVRPSSFSSAAQFSTHVNPSLRHPGGQSIKTFPPTYCFEVIPYFLLNPFSPLHPHPQSRLFNSDLTILVNAALVIQFLPPPHPQSFCLRLIIC
jgi:hypothetical protein